jgi:hypothetical protein
MRRSPVRTSAPLSGLGGTSSDPERALTALDAWVVAPLSPETTGVAAPARPARPWDGVDESRTAQLNVDIPARLHAKLRWVVQQQYGATVKIFVTAAISAAVDQAIKDHGDV